MNECQSSKAEMSSKSTCSHFVENRSRAFRLRPVNTTERIGKKYRYLKSSFLKFVTWTEFALAAGFTLIQVAFLSSCSDEDSFTQASLMGLGLGCIYLFTASVTLVALKEPVYFWLHAAMAMNIVAVVGAIASELWLCVYIEDSSSKPYKPRDVVRQKFHGFTVEDIPGLCKWCNGISGILALILSIACGRPVFLGHRDITFRGSRHTIARNLLQYYKMLPGVLSDPEKLGAVSSIKAHDTKRFRVRAVSSEGEIYERYFSKSLGSKVSWCQLGLSVFVLLAQVTVMVKLMGHFEYYGSSAQIGGGIWSSIITIIAAVITLWASHKAAYGRLHTSMALHIFSLLGQIFAIIFIFSSGISTLKRSMRELKEDSYEDYYSGRYRSYSIDLTTPPSMTIDQIAKRTERNLELYKVFHDTLILNAMMGVAGISQALMSFFMTLSTGRAICCGRTHLEGKFLEMEAVGREDANAVVNFRAKDTPSCHIEKHPEQSGADKISGRDSVTGPPPYSSGLFDHDKC